VRRGDLGDWEEELEVSGSVFNLRVSDGGRMVSSVGERDVVGLAERGGVAGWNMEIGREKARLEGERIDERGVEGQP
jgi:hypothetical protein